MAARSRSPWLCRARVVMPVCLLLAVFLSGHVAAQSLPELAQPDVPGSEGVPGSDAEPVEGASTNEGGAAEDLSVEAFLSDQKLDELPCVPRDFLRDAPVADASQCVGKLGRSSPSRVARKRVTDTGAQRRGDVHSPCAHGISHRSWKGVLGSGSL